MKWILIIFCSVNFVLGQSTKSFFPILTDASYQTDTIKYEVKSSEDTTVAFHYSWVEVDGKKKYLFTENFTSTGHLESRAKEVVTDKGLKIVSIYSMESNRKGYDQFRKVRTSKRYTFSFIELEDWKEFELKEKYRIRFRYWREGTTVIDSVTRNSENQIIQIHLTRKVTETQKILFSKHLFSYKTEMTFENGVGLIRYSYYGDEFEFSAEKIQ